VTPFSVGTRILGVGAVLLVLFLAIGYVLPGSWEAEASRVIAAPADEILPLLDSPEGWQQWTPWPQAGVERSGPDRGAGARLAWDDPELGSGSFTLERASSTGVEYSVDVGDGAMHTAGSISLTPQNGRVEVDWYERGDLGRNPLMGYWALSMGRAQGEELTKGLARLDSLVSARDTLARP